MLCVQLTCHIYCMFKYHVVIHFFQLFLLLFSSLQLGLFPVCCSSLTGGGESLLQDPPPLSITSPGTAEPLKALMDGCSIVQEVQTSQGTHCMRNKYPCTVVAYSSSLAYILCRVYTTHTTQCSELKELKCRDYVRIHSLRFNRKPYSLHSFSGRAQRRMGHRISVQSHFFIQISSNPFHVFCMFHYDTVLPTVEITLPYTQWTISHSVDFK